MLADWPFERNDPQCTGVAASALSDKLDVAWKYSAPGSAFDSTPVVAAGVVYIGDADGTVHALKLADKEVVWTRKVEDSGFASAAAVKGDRLYIGDIYGKVFCLNTADGGEVWSFNAETEVYAGPTIYDDALLVTTEGGKLFALDAATGEKRWEFAIEAPLRCSPLVLGGHTLLAGCDERLHAVDLATGKEVGGLDIGAPTGSTPATRDGKAYFGTEAGEFLAIDAKDPLAMSVQWRRRDPRRGQGIRCDASLGESVAVYGSNGKAIYGVSLETGEPVWTLPTRSRVEAAVAIAKTPTGAERAVVATTRGRLMLLDTATGDAAWEYNAGGGFTGGPAVTDGRLLIGNTDGTLFCFGTEE